MNRVLVLGVTGMLGSEVHRVFSLDPTFEVWGGTRGPSGPSYLSHPERIIPELDVLDEAAILRAMNRVRPDVVVNCVGVIKQLDAANDPLVAIPINALLPHRLALLCGIASARLIHVSTDCVFAGRRGGYVEDDPSDCEDLYGRSKYLGEVTDSEHVITLRTSIIGHEVGSANGLVEWFLSQEGRVRGFARAIFSGLPTVELSHILRDVVIPDAQLAGLYHVAAEPISKLDLLRLVAAEYGSRIEIEEDDSVVIDRSLDASRFERATGYRAPPWPELVRGMRESHESRKNWQG